MSVQLYNPEAKKLVNVSSKQVPTLKKAGWLDPQDDEAIADLSGESQKEPEKEQKKAPKATK